MGLVDFFVCILFEDDGGLSGEESHGCFWLDDHAAGADEEIVGLIGVSSIIFCVAERENRQASQLEEATKRTCCNKEFEVCDSRLGTKKLRI